MYERTISRVLEDTLAGLRAAGPRSPRTHSGRRSDAYVGSMTKDTARARIALIEVVGVNRAIDKRRRDALKAFVTGLANRDRTATASGRKSDRRSRARHLRARRRLGRIADGMVTFEGAAHA